MFSASCSLLLTNQLAQLVVAVALFRCAQGRLSSLQVLLLRQPLAAPNNLGVLIRRGCLIKITLIFFNFSCASRLIRRPELLPCTCVGDNLNTLRHLRVRHIDTTPTSSSCNRPAAGGASCSSTAARCLKSPATPHRKSSVPVRAPGTRAAPPDATRASSSSHPRCGRRSAARSRRTPPAY